MKPEPPNDIEATRHCCCNGCVGEGMCDLAEPEEHAEAWQWYDDPMPARDKALADMAVALDVPPEVLDLDAANHWTKLLPTRRGATVSRYVHAPDDAPLYRVGASLGGKAWPCYRAWDCNGRDCVTLDVNGTLVQFFAEDLQLVVRPEALPDWALEMVTRVIAYEDANGHTEFAEVLDRVPADVMRFVGAVRGDVNKV